MEEHFDTFSEDGQPERPVPRSEVHRRGLWHRAVNVFLFRSDGRLLLQQRHPDKDVCPDRWDLSVAEHLIAGESYLDGAIRGLREELGVTGTRLEALGEETRQQYEDPELGLRDYEFQQCFKGVSDALIYPQVEEVAAVRWVDPGELQAEVKRSPAVFTPWFLAHARDFGLI